MAASRAAFHAIIFTIASFHIEYGCHVPPPVTLVHGQY